MAELLTISLSIDKGYVQLFYITGRFFILPLEMVGKMRNLWKGNQFLSRKTCGIFVLCLCDRGKEKE